MSDKLLKIEDGLSKAMPCADCGLTRGKIAAFFISVAFTVAMIAAGRNFFPLVGAVLCAAYALIEVIFVLKNGKPSVAICCGYAVIMVGLYLFFLIYGAESFGRRVWWNLIFCLPSLALCAATLFLRVKPSIMKATAIVIAIVMIGTSILYFLYMSLRLTPRVDRMFEGEEEYLSYLKGKRAEQAPNVLFILMDDMAYADLSCYSYENAINTPNIDEIADGGIYMENFYASAPVCTPSRFSALTGRYATRGYLDNVIFPTVVDNETFSPTHFINPYQFENNVDGILGDEITIAEALSSLGYDTACIGKWNLGDYGEYLPTNQGFDYFYGSHYVNDMTPYTWVEETGGKFTEVRSHKDNLDQSESTRIFTEVLKKKFSESVEKNNPFFGFYATPWPHYPIYSDYNGNGKGDKSDDSYIKCIEEFDRSLGEIFQYMKDTPSPDGNGSVYDNTLIIFTSDNGPGREGVTGSHRGRKNTTFEGGMKVPALISYPNGGVGKGTVAESKEFIVKNDDGTERKTVRTKKLTSAAMLTDFFPTIIDYATDGRAAMPADRIIDGVSLRKIWSGDEPSDTKVHDALYYMKKGKVQAVRAEIETDGKPVNYKYFENVATENSAFIDQRYKNYLFNLDSDPAEGYNISMTYPEVAAKMKNMLKDFRKELKNNRRGKK